MEGIETTELHSSSAAGTVAVGIFSSKILGFVREMAFAFFFGVGAHVDVIRLSLRAPNLLQNLLGEGVLSAAFIPIYSRMLEEGQEKDAGRFAGAIFGLLLAIASILVLIGVLFADWIVALFAPGWLGDAARFAAGEIEVNKYALAVEAVRIVFPMAGILVLSAWALGVLNSHRRFFVPYFAPVFWNVAIITGLVLVDLRIGGPLSSVVTDAVQTEVRTRLLFAALTGALAGGILQFGFQIPSVVRVMRHFKLSFSLKVKGVERAVRDTGPVIAGRGVVQLSGYIDMFLASYLATGALSALGYAQTLYLLPVSLFGMSIAASELPELSRLRGDRMDTFVLRLNRSIGQILFMVIPTIVGYLGLGFLVAAVLFRWGSFGLNENYLVWFVLAGYTIGLLPATATRLMQNTFYALQDTRTPAIIAAARIGFSAVSAIPLMFFFDQFSVGEVALFTQEVAGDALYLGAIGLSVGGSIGAWSELLLLRRSLRKKIPSFHFPMGPAGRMVGVAILALIPAFVVWWLVSGWNVKYTAIVVLGLYAGAYLGISYLMRSPELDAWAGRFLRRFRK